MERRRAARVQTAFLLAVEGIDERLALRHGDISAAGILVELPAPLGAVGTVQWLRLASPDTARQVGVMAHVVRTMTLDDAAHGARHGVALEFMPESDAAANALQEFVLYVLARKLSSTAMTAVGRRATPAPRAPAAAVVDAAPPAAPKDTVRALDIETESPLVEGEEIEVTLRTSQSGLEVRCHARVGRVTPFVEKDTAAYRARLRIEEVLSGAPGEAELSDWMSRYVVAPETRRPESRGQFEGLLSRIKLPTLLSLVEMDRMSGKLVLSGDKATTTLHVKDGRVLDVTSTLAGDPRAVLRRVLAWTDGTFVFRGGDVQAPDRLGVSTTALVLDLVREEDELRESERRIPLNR